MTAPPQVHESGGGASPGLPHSGNLPGRACWKTRKTPGPRGGDSDFRKSGGQAPSTFSAPLHSPVCNEQLRVSTVQPSQRLYQERQKGRCICPSSIPGRAWDRASRGPQQVVQAEEGVRGKRAPGPGPACCQDRLTSLPDATTCPPHRAGRAVRYSKLHPCSACPPKS